MPFKIGLQTKILLLVVCGLALIFGVFTFLALQMLNEAALQRMEERLDAAKLVASYSDQQLRDALGLLKNLAEPTILDLNSQDGDALRDDLTRAVDQTGLFGHGAFVLDVRGNVVWSTPHEHFPLGAPLPGAGPLASGPEARSPQVSDLVLDGATGTPLVFLFVPIVDRNGNLAGSVGSAADLSAGALGGLLSPMNLWRTSYAEIVDRSGRVLASTRDGRFLQRDEHADRFFALIREQQPMVGRCYRCHEAVSEERQNDVLAFSPLQSAPWGIAVRQLEDEVLAPTREMAKRIVVVAVPLFAAALFLAWLTTSRVVRPIRTLTAAAERIANGDLDFGVQSTGNDEVGALATTFDGMRMKLKQSYQDIAAWNRDLEQRVEQRTRELSAIFEASQMAAATLDVGTLLSEIVPRLLGIIRQAGAGVLYLRSDEDGLLVPRSSYGYDQAALARLRLAPGEGVAGKVFLSGRATLFAEPNALGDALADFSPANIRSWAEATAATGGPCCSIGVPLVARGRSMGCLVLDHFRPEQCFGDVDLSLAQTIADRIAAAVENARLYEELQRKEHLRGQLLEKVMVAQEEERKRIARELHDETGQSLTALAISLASAHDALPPDANGVTKTIEQAKSLADKLLAETRRLISDLRPTVLDDLGLVPALRRYASTHSGLLQLDIQLHVEGRRRRLPAQTETALFRIVQEAITNVAKHAQAKNVSVRLAFEDERVAVVIQDDGRGFDVAGALRGGDPGQGVGLLGMRERVTLLGGTLEVLSQPGAGSTLIASLPLEPEEVLINE